MIILQERGDAYDTRQKKKDGSGSSFSSDDLLPMPRAGSRMFGAGGMKMLTEPIR